MSHASWGFSEGDEIVPGRLALKSIGGGRRYEALLAWDEGLFSLVVVKILRPDRVEEESSIRQLIREANVLDRLAHPGLVRKFGQVTKGPRPHLVLEHLEGPTLRRLIRKQTTLPMEQLLPLALHVASVLHYMGAQGVLHLDVKPGNIVMGSPPRLVDLSIARTTEEAANLKVPVGTDAYMSPEQALPGSAPIGPAADVWGLGATLYEAATGLRPFPKPDRESRAPHARFPQTAQPAPAMDPRLPARLRDLVAACLNSEPANRPSASEASLALEPLVAALPRRPTLRLKRPRI